MNFGLVDDIDNPFNSKADNYIGGSGTKNKTKENFKESPNTDLDSPVNPNSVKTLDDYRRDKSAI